MSEPCGHAERDQDAQRCYACAVEVWRPRQNLWTGQVAVHYADRVDELEAERDKLLSVLKMSNETSRRRGQERDQLAVALAEARAALEEIGRDDSGPSARLAGRELTKTVAARIALRRIDALLTGGEEK